MKYLKTLLLGLFTLLTHLCFNQVNAPKPQNQENMGQLRVYLDCNYCDHGFIKQNMKNVTFVRDAKQADVHILFISQNTGGGGTAEKIQFIGLGIYKKLSDILPYTTNANMADIEKRDLRMKILELGLMRFRLEAGQMNEINLSINAKETEGPIEIIDPWNSWVFSMNANGWFSGEETSKTFNYSGGAAARRITEESKSMVSGGFKRDQTNYDYDGVKTQSKKKSSWASAQQVFSMNDHWSYGFFGSAGNSLFSNYNLYLSGKTGIEFDFFKYSESFNKQAIIAYNIGARYNDYYDTTVFNQLSENLAFHEVTIGGKVKQNWGNLSSTITYQNYLHDFNLNSVSLWMNVKVRLFKGFSWRLNGSFNIRQNQVNIARQNASIEDVLLQQQELGSNYSYWMNTGINYSFGSMYNSVVNPRFNI
ncbi:hypothetical protein [Crocinitomix algicola]|uniref:hypothetical protein n=1 Tax=Crocinitomix algicola TaxID=1740263 RepID=UPI00082AD0A5|nr:hypothetical protein [Crocinitomix algicola]